MATDLDFKIRELESKAELSEFETQRLRTLRENRELFAKLGIGAGGLGTDSAVGTPSGAATPALPLPPTASGLRPAKRAKRAPAGPTAANEAAPARFSLRLRGVDAANAAPQPRDLAVEIERELRTRRPGPVPLRVVDDEPLDDSDEAEDSVKDEAKAEAPETSPIGRYARKLLESLNALSEDVPEPPAPEDMPEAEMRRQIGGLGLEPQDGSLKATRERVYSAAWHPATDKLLFAVGDKTGAVAFVDASSGPEPDVYRVQPHVRPVSGLRFDARHKARLYTCSYDASIRQLDVAHEAFEEVAVHPDDTWITSFDFDKQFNTLYFSDGHGFVGRRDLREPWAPGRARFAGLSDRKVTSVAVHPLEPHFLLAAGLARQVMLFDARKMTKASLPGDAEDLAALVVYEQHEKSVSSAFWAADGASFVTTSYDDTVRFWPSPVRAKARVDSSPTPSGIVAVRHNNQTGRWVTNFRATPHPSLPVVAVGNMDRGVDLLHSQSGATLGYLNDPQRLTAVPAVSAFHPSLFMVGSGNASGRVNLWMPRSH